MASHIKTNFDHLLMVLKPEDFIGKFDSKASAACSNCFTCVASRYCDTIPRSEECLTDTWCQNNWLNWCKQEYNEKNYPNGF